MSKGSFLLFFYFSITSWTCDWILIFIFNQVNYFCMMSVIQDHMIIFGTIAPSIFFNWTLRYFLTQLDNCLQSTLIFNGFFLCMFVYILALHTFLFLCMFVYILTLCLFIYIRHGFEFYLLSIFVLNCSSVLIRFYLVLNS